MAVQEDPWQGLKNAIEPSIIISIFLTATYVNRSRQGDRNGCTGSTPHEAILDVTEPLLKNKYSTQPVKSHGIEEWLPYPDTHRFRNNLFSRVLRKFPFLIEMLYWAVTYWPYQLCRAYTALHISSNPTREAAVKQAATDNALHVLHIEQRLGLDIEQPLQHFILGKEPWVMWVLCRIYLAHILVGIVFIAYGYTYFPRDKYQRVRRNIAINNWLAFIVLSLYRCTPPRLMPASYQFVDVLHPHPGPGNDWNNNRFKLTLAAMPSLHFGTAMLIGISTARWGKHMPLRILAPSYPLIMGFVVLATANHWVLDCVAGALVVWIGWKMNWVLLALRPIEEWLCWLLRIEKPIDEMATWKDCDYD